MEQRFFHVDPVAYEKARLALDRRWGYAPGTGTDTCVTPAAAARRNASGRVVLAVWDRVLASEEVRAILPAMLASGTAVEITLAEYEAAMPRGTP